MILSCGTIITDGEYILLGKSGGNNFWDLPKGKQELGEYPEQTAIREAKEEFNITLNPQNMSSIGRFNYLKNKDLYLFLYQVENLPKISEMKCNSTFEIKGREIPEITKFEYVPFSLTSLKKYMGKSLYKLFEKNKFQLLMNLNF